MALPGSNLPISLIYSTLGVSNGREIFYIGETLKTKTQLEALVNKNSLDAMYCPGVDADARITNLLADRRLSYFKGYGTIVDINVTYDFSNIINVKINTSTIEDKWQRVDILPAGSGRSGAAIIVKLFNVSDFFNGTVTVYYGVGDNPTTEPSWISFTNDPIFITIQDGEYLFMRIRVTRFGTDSEYATATLTLQDGSVVFPNTGTVTASGSPLAWTESTGIPV